MEVPGGKIANSMEKQKQNRFPWYRCHFHDHWDLHHVQRKQNPSKDLGIKIVFKDVFVINNVITNEFSDNIYETLSQKMDGCQIRESWLPPILRETRQGLEFCKGLL